MKLLLRLLLTIVILAVVAGLVVFAAPLWVADHVLWYKLWRQGVRSEYVEVDGNRIHYLEALPSSNADALAHGQPIVLIHGLGSRAEDFAGMIPVLASSGFHVYALDLLGYGRSARPDVDYSISLETETVTEFMRELGLEHADVDGVSMGGWVALKLAADRPELVNRLVVNDSAGVYFPPTFDATLFTPDDAAGLEKLTAMLTPQKRQIPAFVSRAVTRRLRANSWVVDRSFESMEDGRDLMDFRLRQITEPTLIVWGAVDQLIPIEAGRKLFAGIPGSNLLVVDGCGHLAFSECMQPVLAGTIGFLTAKKAPEKTEHEVKGAPQP